MKEYLSKMKNIITQLPIPGIPIIKANDNLGKIIYKAISENEIELKDNDIICIASKIVSLSENLIVDLKKINASEVAYKISKSITRKDPRIIQLMIDQTNDPEGNNILVKSSWIGAKLKNGLILTSGGIDKISDEHVVLLPDDSDKCALKIGRQIFKLSHKRVAIVITDSDGREGRSGSTQIAIGSYGINPLRISKNNEKIIEETLVDMIAASAGLYMGQKNFNQPVVLIKGIEFEFNENFELKNILH